MMLKRILTVVAAVVALAGCAAPIGSLSNDPRFATLTKELPSQTGDPLINDLPEYRFGPQDEISIAVFQLPDFTVSTKLDSQGAVLLPLIGKMQAGGRTASEFSGDVAEKLKEKYLQDPQVQVSLKAAAGGKIVVDGAVAAPGVYPIGGRSTLLQAVALAKGVTADADPKKVAIFRNIEGKRLAARFDLVAIRSGNAPDPEVFGSDVIVVDGSTVRSGMRSILFAIPLMRFAPLL